MTKLGIAGYGTWEALQAAAALSSIVTAPIIGTVLWEVARAHGVNDQATITRTIRLAATVVFGLLLVLAPTTYALAAPVARLLNIGASAAALVGILLPGVVVIVLLTALCEVVETGIVGRHQAGLVAINVAASTAANLLTTLAAIYKTPSLLALLGGAVVGVLSRLTLGLVGTKRLTGQWPSLKPLRPTTLGIGERSRYAGYLAVGNVSAALRDQTDKLVLASMASPQWVGYYGIASRLASLVLEISRFFYNPLLAAAATLHATSNAAGLRALYGKVMGVVPVLAGLVVLGVGGVPAHLQMAWLGRVAPEVTLILTLLLTGNAFAVILTGAGTSICRGIGRVDIETRYVVLNLLLNAIFTVALVIAMGPLGSVVASATTWAIASVAFLVILHRNTDLPWRASARAGGALAITLLFGTALRVVAGAGTIQTDRMAALATAAALWAVAATGYVAVLVAFRFIRLDVLQAIHVATPFGRSRKAG